MLGVGGDASTAFLPRCSPEERDSDRRARLIGAALVLYSERRTPDVPIAVLCRAAGITTRQFYEIFRDRDELFHAACESSAEIALHHTRRAIAGGGDIVESVLRAILDPLFSVERDSELGRAMAVLFVLGASYFGHWFTYNSYLVNYGSWVKEIPGWQSYGEPGAMIPEPIVLIGPVYVYFIMAATLPDGPHVRPGNRQPLPRQRARLRRGRRVTDRSLTSSPRPGGSAKVRPARGRREVARSPPSSPGHHGRSRGPSRGPRQALMASCPGCFGRGERQARLDLRTTTWSAKLADMASPKSNTRKEEILRVATELFRTRGFHGTRMDDVADTAGLNKATVYHYYDSKATILYDLYLKATGEIAAVLDTVTTDASPAAELMAYVDHTFKLIVSNPAQASVYFQESPFLDQWLSPEQVADIRAREVAVDHHVREIFKRGIDEGVFLKFDLSLLTVGFLGMTSWFYRWYDVDSSRYAPEDVAWEFGRIFLSGILVDRSLTPPARTRRRRRKAPAATAAPTAPPATTARSARSAR